MHCGCSRGSKPFPPARYILSFRRAGEKTLFLETGKKSSGSEGVSALLLAGRRYFRAHRKRVFSDERNGDSALLDPHDVRDRARNHFQSADSRGGRGAQRAPPVDSDGPRKPVSSRPSANHDSSGGDGRDHRAARFRASIIGPPQWRSWSIPAWIVFWICLGVPDEKIRRWNGPGAGEEDKANDARCISGRTGRLQPGGRGTTRGARVYACSAARRSRRFSRPWKTENATERVIPIENTLHGSVHENYDLLLRFDSEYSG